MSSETAWELLGEPLTVSISPCETTCPAINMSSNILWVTSMIEIRLARFLSSTSRWIDSGAGSAEIKN